MKTIEEIVAEIRAKEAGEAEAGRTKLAEIRAQQLAREAADAEAKRAQDAAYSAEVKKRQLESQTERFETAKLFGKTSAKTLDQFLEEDAQADKVRATQDAIRRWKTLS